MTGQFDSYIRYSMHPRRMRMRRSGRANGGTIRWTHPLAHAHAHAVVAVVAVVVVVVTFALRGCARHRITSAFPLPTPPLPLNDVHRREAIHLVVVVVVVISVIDARSS